MWDEHKKKTINNIWLVLKKGFNSPDSLDFLNKSENILREVLEDIEKLRSKVVEGLANND